MRDAPGFRSIDEQRVFADALLQAGDPQGELITLSLQVSKTPRMQARITELETWCAQRVLAECPGIVPHTLTWRDGLLAACMVTRDVYLRPHPAWHALEALQIVVLELDFAMPDLTLPHLAALRRLVLRCPSRPRPLGAVTKFLAGARGLGRLESLVLQVQKPLRVGEWLHGLEATVDRPGLVKVVFDAVELQLEPEGVITARARAAGPREVARDGAALTRALSLRQLSRVRVVPSAAAELVATRALEDVLLRGVSPRRAAGSRPGRT